MTIYAAGLVIDQTVKEKFRFRTIDEVEQRRVEKVERRSSTSEEESENPKEKSSTDYIEVA
ncbi:hypothetical protein PTI98_006446 [Pleurotus ostreatus]|nr:hypothetical protein PTI98_006446 [Pleurotus ostreatus]